MPVISEGGDGRSAQAVTDLAAFGEARGDILNLQQGVRAAEAGQRGWLLTRRWAYLSPYATALVDIDGSLQLLDRYPLAHPTGHELLDGMPALTEAKLSEPAVAIPRSQRTQQEADGSHTRAPRQTAEDPA